MMMHAPLSGRPVATSRLPPPDRLLLWAIRAWVIGLKRRIDVREPIRSAFGRLKVAETAEAADLIEALMSIVACGAVRPLAVECVCHKVLSDDERCLLRAATLHQDGRGFEARFLLRTILSPTASSGAGEILDRLGLLLAGAGLRPLGWAPQTERYVRAPGPNDDEPPPTPPTLH
jgi:hypothetical protein